MKKLLTLILVLGMTICVLAACASESAADSAGVAATTMTTTSESVEPDAIETLENWPRTIVDGAGNEVILEKKTERVTLLHIVYLEHFLQLGTPPTAAAIGNAFGEFESLEASKLFGPYIQGAEISLLGNSVDLSLEAVLESEPDAIVTFYTGSPLEQYEQLSAIAPVVQIDYYAAWQDQLRMVAEVLGKEVEAEAYIEEIEAIIAAAREEIAPNADRTLALFRTDGKGFIPQGFSQYYTEFGIAKPEGLGETYETISLEAVAEMNPYYIVFQHNASAVEAFVESMADSSVWNALDAVKNDRVYYFDENMNSYGPLTWRMASEQLVEIYTTE